jgi:hypothetical protein
MSRYDILIRGGTIVTPSSTVESDIAVSDEVVAVVEPGVEGSAKAEIAASGLHIFPGLVDAHVRCVWLIPNADGVRFWLQRMSVGGQFRVVRVWVRGRLHTASESYLLQDSELMGETIEKARRYWRGDIEQAGTEEIIFEGRMHVEEVMPPDFYA